MAKVKDNYSNKDERWPWDWQKEELTPAVLAKIIKFLPSCALDATGDKTEEVGISDSLYGDFQVYCHVVKDHFEQVAKDASASAKGKLSQITEEAFELVDLLVEWVKKTIRRNDSGINARYMAIDDPCSHTELASRWDTIMRKFNLCMSSQRVKKGQDEKPPQDSSEQQVTSKDTIEIDLSQFSDSGSYRLLHNLLSDSERQGVQLNKERHGSTKRQPKTLKELLKDKANKIDLPKLKFVADKIKTKRKKDNNKIVFLDIFPEKISVIHKENRKDKKN